MTASLAAEWLKIRTRPATWILAGIWLVLTLAFAYGVPYIVYHAIGDDPGRDLLLAGLLPAELASTGAALFPLFGGPIMLILGALASGSEYRWGTWAQSVTQAPSRGAVFAGKAAALAGALAAIVLATWVVAAAASAVVAAAESRPLAYPGALEILRGVGASWLIAVAWGLLGLALGVVLRSSAAAIAAGLVWGLAIESAISGLAFVVPAVEVVQPALLSANAGSLVHALGAATVTDAGTPGVVDVVGGGQAVVVLVLYSVAFVLAGMHLVRRRDLV